MNFYSKTKCDSQAPPWLMKVNTALYEYSPAHPISRTLPGTQIAAKSPQAPQDSHPEQLLRQSRHTGEEQGVGGGGGGGGD